jgi:predicted transcriptional regulator
MALSETQAKVLAALFAESPRALPVRKLSGWVDLSEHTAKYAMRALERSGFAESTARGWRITTRGRAMFQRPVFREYRDRRRGHSAGAS